MSTADESTKVLLVSSDTRRMENISEHLKNGQSYLEIEIASDSSQALELMKNKKYHVLVSDYLVGSRNAMEFAFEIRRTFKFKPEIILMTDQKDLSLHECHQVGIAQIVDSPQNVKALAIAIEWLSPNSRRFGHQDFSPASLATMYGQVIGRKPLHTTFKMEVSNIGRSGFYYNKLSDPKTTPEIGQIVDFEITLAMLPNTKISGVGIVRWSRYENGDRGYGIEFLSMPEESEKLLMAYIELFKIEATVPGAVEAA